MQERVHVTKGLLLEGCEEEVETALVLPPSIAIDGPTRTACVIGRDWEHSANEIYHRVSKLASFSHKCHARR